ncbi:MAG TPA: peptidase P60 [Alphaproteobacteria bacterium]|nr:peptidase P60 [Alphaproteobacteria bacterium]HAJ45159.1 peptidase P60 [Alphaproteobacteria bacterium]
MAFDKRITPARADLAALSLRGTVEADRFSAGERAIICAPVADLLTRPMESSGLDTQGLFGETVTVFERANGWAWVQFHRDSYVGYMNLTALSTEQEAATHWVTAVRAPVFSAADLKSPRRAFLPMNAQVQVTETDGKYARLGRLGWVATQHIAPLSERAKDWVAVAETCWGAPYLWGGCTPDGLDCSGLVQVAHLAAGRKCPRDADMQEAELGTALPQEQWSQLRRGDLVFWKGHVGIMCSETELLHANAHHMCVAVEPLDKAVERIAAASGPVTSVKRQ